MRPELLLRLYPRAWRERYGEELLALIETQSPLGLGAWLDLLRGALAAHLHPLAARPAIALRLTRWVPLVAVSVAAAMVLINFWMRARRLESLVVDVFELREGSWVTISPTMSRAEALLYFNFKAEKLNDLALHLGMLAFAFAAALMWAVVARRFISRSHPL